MDFEIPIVERRKRTRRRLIRMLAILLGVILAITGFRHLLTPRLEANRILVATVERGDVAGGRPASGLVVPLDEFALSTPVPTRIDSLLLGSGDSVRVGERIMAIDLTQLVLNLGQAELDLETARNRRVSKHLALESLLIDLDTEADIKDESIKVLMSRLVIEESLLKQGIGLRETVDLSRMDLQIARLEKERITNQIANRRRQNEIESTEMILSEQNALNRVNEVRRQLKQARMESPIDGVVVWVNPRCGSAVYAGEVLVRVSSLRRFRVKATIPDIYAGDLHPDVPVIVRADESVLAGRIDQVEPEIINGVLHFTIALDNPSAPSLRFNRSTDVTVITASRRNVLRIPANPNIRGSGDNTVFVVNGHQALRREIKTGAVNSEWIEVLQGLQPGERVIISSTEAIKHLRKVEINK